MSTYYINGWAAWQSAITASQTTNNAYTTFKLTTNITFTATNTIHLFSGSATTDTSYLYLGSGSTLDCNYYTITINSGQYGLCRTRGTSTMPSTICNFAIVNNVQGYTCVAGYYSTIVPTYTVITNGTIYTTTSQLGNNAGALVWYGSSSVALYTTITYVAIRYSAAMTAAAFAQFFDGTMSNCLLITPGLSNYTGMLMYGPTNRSTTTISSCYIYSSVDEGGFNSNQAVVWSAGPGSYVTTFSDIYYVSGTAYNSTKATGAYFFTFNNNTISGNIQITNFYTNKTSFTLNSQTAVTPIVTTNFNTSFIWASGPTFSDYTAWTTTSTPYRLTCFTAFPFDSTIYTSYNTMPAFLTYLTAPCFCAGMHIATPRGNIPVEDLKIGDDVYTPDNRIVPIVDIFHVEVVGDEENIPHRIPVDFFIPDVPNREVLLSPHHGLFDLRHKKWTLTRWVEPAIPRVEELLGERFTYYHIALPEYTNDKLICHLLPVDSWDKSKPVEF